MSSAVKTALISGGEGDLAKAIASNLEAGGYSVKTPGKDELDVLSLDSVTNYFSDIKALDLLVTTAGHLDDKIHKLQPPEDRNLLIDTHLRGTFLCAQSALKLMSRQKQGHLIFISSQSAITGSKGQTAYSAAKAGVISLTKSLAQEYGKRNVRVNCVLPGFLETKMTKKILETQRETILSNHTLGRLSSLSDAARFITFLDTTANISGQTFHLDNRITKW